MNPMTIKQILLFFLILTMAASGAAQTIFVSPTCNDKNPGTKEKPVASFSRAQMLARKIPAANAVVLVFANGTY